MFPFPCLQADRVEEQVDERYYTSTRIRSVPAVSFLTGRIEASIQLPVGVGLWAAFWMLPTNSTRGNWAATGEIDIMEVRVEFIVPGVIQQRCDRIYNRVAVMKLLRAKCFVFLVLFWRRRVCVSVICR